MAFLDNLRPWRKGQSGNPKGRPPKKRRRRTRAPVPVPIIEAPEIARLQAEAASDNYHRAMADAALIEDRDARRAAERAADAAFQEAARAARDIALYNKMHGEPTPEVRQSAEDVQKQRRQERYLETHGWREW